MARKKYEFRPDPTRFDWVGKLLLKMKKKMDAAKKGGEGKKEKSEKQSGGMNISLKGVKGMMDMMGGFTVLRMTGMVGMVGISYDKEELLKMNEQLNKIKAPKK